MDKQLVGIVIVNYNRGELVQNISQRFAGYAVVDNIVIIDNNSTDDSRVKLKNLANKKIKCFFLDRNIGYAGGNNMGLKYLKEDCGCDYCFIVNPDVYFEEKVINRIVDAFEQQLDYAIITCARIDPLSTTPQIQYSTRVLDTFFLQFLSYFNLARHYYLLKRYGVYHYNTSECGIRQIAVAPGSFFGIRMKAFPDSTVMDEGTFLYGEEDLLAMRCQQLGLKEGFISNVVYEHRHIQYSTTLSKKSILPIKYGMRSKRYFQNKYLNLNIIEKLLIVLAEKISLLERRIILLIKQ